MSTRKRQAKCVISPAGPQKERAGDRQAQAADKPWSPHRPEEKSLRMSSSFVEGYPLKEGSDASARHQRRENSLCSRKKDSAWAATPELDKTIVEAMAKGKQAIVKGMPQKKGQADDRTPTRLPALPRPIGDDRQGLAAIKR